MIEVGEYVRTSKGIFRIRYVDNNKTINKYSGDDGHMRDNDGDRVYSIIKTTDITKHSKNLIDLVEVGDFVSGYRVDEIILDNVNHNLNRLKCNDGLILFFNEDIKSILTHEMYEANCFKVGDFE